MTFSDDGQRGSCSASEAATTALVVATRAAVGRSLRPWLLRRTTARSRTALYGARRQPPWASEEAASETYYAPRGLKTLPLGMRPAPPSEVAGPQGAAATVGFVAAGAPLLVVASLAGRVDVDATTVSFLVAENLKLQKRRRRRGGGSGRRRSTRRACGSLTAGCGLQLTLAESYAWRKWAGFLSPVSRGERKRGRRKNFLVLLGLVVDVPALFSDKFQQSKEFYRFVLQMEFISRMWDIPVVEERQRRDIRQVQFLVDVDAPRCCATTGIWSDSAECRAGAAVARRSTASLRAAEANPHRPACSQKP